MINVIGLGPGEKDDLTLGTIEFLKNCDNVFLRTFKHPTVDYLKEINIKFETYDDVYDKANSFDEVYASIAVDLIKKHQEFQNIVYAVPGHPRVAEKSVDILVELCKKSNIQCNVHSAVSFIDTLMERLQIDPIEGLKIIDAFDIKNQILDKRAGLIITQVYNNFIASEVKIALSEYYSDDMDIFFVRAAGVKDLESIRKIKLYEIDRQQDIDYLTSLYIPKASKTDAKKDFYDLLSIMDVLRSEDGCPWDREQTHESLKRYLIEESYEVLEAIDGKNDENIVEELGDVLLQIVFHAQIAKEDGYYNINDITQGICNKMIERHPHVFENEAVNNSDEVISNWDEIKKKEKKYKNHTDELKHVAKNLPALIRAEKIQAKASKVGFDWDKVEEAMSKVEEELLEVKNVYKLNNMAKIQEEIGDLIFSCVNVSRFLDIDPEFALNYTIDKFISRFQYIEENAEKNGNKIEEMTLQAMDELWNEAKKQLS